MNKNQENFFGETIVIGAGAAGLFFAANYKKENLTFEDCILLEKKASTGNKLLASGGGCCNLTQDGAIKNFISKYGKNGKAIRKTLFLYNNKKLIEYFQGIGIELTIREDGKVFPKSMKAKEVKEALEKEAEKNYVKIKCEEEVNKIEKKEDGTFLLNDKYTSENIVIATGGASYKGTGSDGKMFKILSELGLEIVPPTEALVPIEIKDYPFGDIEGVAVQDCKVKIFDGETNKKIDEKEGAILFTDRYLTGPAILNISRYYKKGHKINLKFTKEIKPIDTKNINHSIGNYISKTLSMPKALALALLKYLKIEPNQKASAVSAKTLMPFVEGFTFEIIGCQGFEKAMATKGGVGLEEINMDTFESKKIKNLYVIGEALDVDGDTGGYNLQFAFSSAKAACRSILEKH